MLSFNLFKSDLSRTFVLCLLGCLTILGFGGCTREELFAVGSIHGITKDVETGNILSNCNVSLNPSGRSLTTGSDGMFEFLNLTPGHYTLTARREQYADEQLQVEVVAGRMAEKDLVLHKRQMELGFSLKAIDFGDLTSEMKLNIVAPSANRSVPFTIETTAPWLTINPTEGTATQQPVVITLIADRSKLPLGKEERVLSVKSEFGTQEIPVRIVKVTPQEPTVKLVSVQPTSEREAKAVFQLVRTGGSNITEMGVCMSETNREPTIADNKFSLGSTTSIGEYPVNLTGLVSEKTYYVRAYAQNASGMSYSQTITLTMPHFGAPMTTTNEVVELRHNAATLRGVITNDGGAAVVEAGFEYGTDPQQLQKKNVASVRGELSLQLEGLQPKTTYYYRSYARNGVGTSYGALISFTTLEAPNIVFVSAITGDDLNDGTSWQTAKRTIKAAAKVATKGQVIWVTSGDYTVEGMVDVKNNIIGGFRGDESHPTERSSKNSSYLKGGTFNLNLMDGFSFWKYASIILQPSEGSEVVLRNCKVPGDAIVHIDNQITHLKLYDSQIADVDANESLHSHFVPEKGRETTLNIQSYRCKIFRRRFDLENDKVNYEFYNSLLASCKASNSYHNATISRITNCTIFKCDFIKVSVCANSLILDSTIREDGIYRAFKVEHCFNCASDSWKGSLPNANIAISKKEEVVNKDFHLLENSPLINKGSNIYVMKGESDLDGNARIHGGTVDIGCYEYGSSPMSTRGLNMWVTP